MAKHKPMAAFKVRYRRWVVTVNVWSSLSELRREFNRSPGRKGGGVRAFCRALQCRVPPGYRLTREFAEVHFTRRELGTMILTHEFTHAGLALMRRKGLLEKLEICRDATSVSDAEEYLCDAVGEMMRQAVGQLYKLGLLV